MSKLRKRWRRIEVRLQRNPRVQGALQGLYNRYLDFVYRTSRWDVIGLETFESEIARGIPRIMCCWHARLAMVTYFRPDWSDHRLTILTSQHADAQIVARFLRRRGIGTIDVATSADNTGPIRQALKAIKAGGSLGIAADGPLGPDRVVKPGALVIGALARVQVSPASYAVNRKFRLKTWDRFMVPLPFSRGVIAVGDGFFPDRGMGADQMQEACARLGTMIDDLTERCEAHLRTSRRERRDS